MRAHYLGVLIKPKNTFWCIVMFELEDLANLQ